MPMTLKNFELLSLPEQLELWRKVSVELDNVLKKFMRFWCKEGRFSNCGLRLYSISEPCWYESVECGNYVEPKRGDQKFAKSELEGRWKSVKAIYLKNNNFLKPDFRITLQPLRSPFDYIVEVGDSVMYFEAKDRDYSSDSSILKNGVILEDMKVQEAFREGVWDKFVYSNTFSDGVCYNWIPSTLERNVWVPKFISCPDSTIKYQKMVSKKCYLLPMELRETRWDSLFI